MSATTIIATHIAYELIDDDKSGVVAIEFLSPEIVGPVHARELGEQLQSLLRAGLPRSFVLDFNNVRLLGSTAFGEIFSFARQAGRVYVCNMQSNLRLGAALIGLDDYVECAANRRVALNAARRAASPSDEDTVDYPVLRS